MKLALALAYLITGLAEVTLAILVGTIGYPITCGCLAVLALSVTAYMAYFTITR